MTLKRKENIVYLVLWIVVFFVPVARLLSGTEDIGQAPSWSYIVRFWQSLIPYLLLFLLHNYLISPLLIEKGFDRKYLIFVAILFIGFAVYVSFIKSVRPVPPGDASGLPDWREPTGPPPGGLGKPYKAPLRPFPPEVTKILMAFLVIGVNLSIKFFFKSLQDQRDIETLRQKDLENQMQYLRYQINPHFFMNTLNNIHALVDIDPEKSKDSIVRLSKMMRYMLYEGDKQVIPLSREIEFLNQYISLMKIRYSDSVRISLSTPEGIIGASVPPLLFISFVENAFKHGVSYKNDSFIDVILDVKDSVLIFKCDNSIVEASVDDGLGGIGLENTTRRLDLLYGDDYTLDIKEDEGVFKVKLVIPFFPRAKFLEV